MTQNKPTSFRRLLATPPRWVEWLLWLAVIGTALGVRLYLIHLLPAALWSKDAGSYATSAFRWVHTGIWETDPRRGPIYSLLIAGCTKVFGSIYAVMVCQHGLGFLAILATLVAARIWLGRTAVVPLLLCGFALALFGLPILLEHLIRNESLLFFFGSMAWASWLLALRRQQARWLWITGICSALLTLTKNVYGPFPLLLVAGHLYFFRATLPAAVRQVTVFVIAFAIPVIGVKVLNTLTPHNRPPEPQPGILFYGRTAQFTVLEGGRYPELKTAIRTEVEEYRKLPRLDNNIILKHTVVPHLQRILTQQGKLPADLNRLCWELSLEGINANRVAYLKQVINDFQRLLFTGAKRISSPASDELDGVREMLHRAPQEPLMDVPRTLLAIHSAKAPGHFRIYRAIISLSWLFRFGAVAITTLLLPWFFWRSESSERLWWLTLAGVWCFTLAMLSTVGRPLDRYLIPVIPVMFWTLTYGFVLLWSHLALRFGPKSIPEPAVKTTA